MDYEDRSFFQDEDELQYALKRMRRKRSAQGMSGEDAKKICEGIIEESTAGKMCKTVPGFDMAIAMKQCITDLKVRHETLSHHEEQSCSKKRIIRALIGYITSRERKIKRGV